MTSATTGGQWNTAAEISRMENTGDSIISSQKNRSMEMRASIEARQDEIDARFSATSSSATSGSATSGSATSGSATSSQTSADEALNRTRGLLARVSDLDAMTRADRGGNYSAEDEAALALQVREAEQMEAQQRRAGMDYTTVYNPKVTVSMSGEANITSMRDYSVSEAAGGGTTGTDFSTVPQTAPAKQAALDEDPALWSFNKP